MASRLMILLSGILLSSLTIPAFSQKTTAADVQNMADRLDRQTFKDCFFSMKAIYEDGTVIASVNSDKKLCPASNMKVVSTGAGLVKLGNDYKWETGLSYSGKLSDGGVLEGDLYITGSGDPLLGAKIKGADTAASLFGKWLALLKTKGITQIKGNIIGNGSWLEGMREEPGWQYADIGTYYGTCLSGLNFYENRKDFIFVPGTSVGDGLSIRQSYPDTPWMKWEYQCHTGERGTGDRIYLYTGERSTTGVIRGTLAVDRGKKTVMFRNNFPEYTLAVEFRKFLQTNGMKVSGEAFGIPFSPDGKERKMTKKTLKDIGSTCSIPLSDVVEHTNKTSDNLCAEIIFRTLGKKCTGHNDSEHSRQAVTAILKDSLGLDCSPSRFVMMDGSGLSGTNLLSSAFMCDFLLKMNNSSSSQVFRSSLFKYSDRVVLKTGSIRGCRTLCGYVLPVSPSGKVIVFSIMVNHSQMTMFAIEKQEKILIDALKSL